MMKKALLTKRSRLARRKNRTGAKLLGTAVRPRLSVQRSLLHIRCQLIDDMAGKTLASASDEQLKTVGNKTVKAQAVGAAIAAAAQQLKITQAVFDRSGNAYHGRVKALADAAREGGLQL